MLYIGDVFKEAHPETTDIILRANNSKWERVLVLWLIHSTSSTKLIGQPREATTYLANESYKQYLSMHDKKRLL